MTTLLIQTESMPLTVNFPAVVRMSHEQFYEFCQANPNLRIERTATGDVIIRPPAFSDTGNRNFNLAVQLGIWTEQEGFELKESLSDDIKTELAWASHLLLTNTATRSLVVYYRGSVLLRRGILSPSAEVTPGDILKRVMEKQKPVYLVSLKLYPGRLEFSYLPENTQGVICQPLGSEGALILGANAPRSYTRQDEIWIEGIADKLANTLARSLVS